MWVQIPPSKRKMTPYLALASKLGILQTKACIRAELEAKQISHTTAKREMS